MPYAFRWIILQVKRFSPSPPFSLLSSISLAARSNTSCRCMINKGIPADEISTGIGKFIFYYVFERGLNKPEYTGYMLFTRISVTPVARDNMGAITQQLRKRMESPYVPVPLSAILPFFPSSLHCAQLMYSFADSMHCTSNRYSKASSNLLSCSPKYGSL